MTRRTILRSLALITLLLLATPALAGSSARGFVQSKQGELAALVKDGSEGSNKKLQALFDEIIDYDTLAKGSLDEHWAERSEAERAEFTDILRQLVRRAYRKNLDKTLGYEISYEGETKVGTGQLVRTVARNKKDAREDPIAIDYLVEAHGGSWRITDIVTEGSSLVKNYRRQFARIIDKKGFPELLRRMKRKLKEG